MAQASREAGGPDFDVAIVGAGPVGLALAAWLARRSASAGLAVALVDAREPEEATNDPRAIAVSEGSRMLLEPLGAWPADAHPIERIHVSERGRFGRTLIERDEHGLAALGYVVRYGSLVQTLARTVRRTAVHWFTSTSALLPRNEPGDDALTLPLETAAVRRTVRARIVVNAEGGLFGEVRTGEGEGEGEDDRSHGAAGSTEVARRTMRDYRQTALVGVVSVAIPQPDTAWERFTDEGPIALLPMGGVGQADYALVWCMLPDEATRRAGLADAELLDELGRAFGSRMGRFEAIRGRAAFPLGLAAAKTLVDGRIAAIGNAAQTLHPVAGQGLNLGLRDAHALADALARLGPVPEALAAFAQARRFDRRLTIGATDTLARLFTADLGPLSPLRGLALTALEFLPPAKTALARQMMFGQRQ
ncbi:UbiH/UbiF/VisC/COQ6 family ubiquinone biosynthesis hydroxylase [Paraburkholderia sp. NMBU_R16]|uniref:UbiH/UbiF/VisC/COQ6 family ubiquinone biosynthesis hydroxylase n=1 Tax=Paraburkholderia sp. NMBU_R16 TaxID=2698676 RepID=UPI00349F7C1D